MLSDIIYRAAANELARARPFRSAFGALQVSASRSGCFACLSFVFMCHLIRIGRHPSAAAENSAQTALGSPYYHTYATPCPCDSITYARFIALSSRNAKTIRMKTNKFRLRGRQGPEGRGTGFTQFHSNMTHAALEHFPAQIFAAQFCHFFSFHFISRQTVELCETYQAGLGISLADFFPRSIYLAFCFARFCRPFLPAPYQRSFSRAPFPE